MVTFTAADPYPIDVEAHFRLGGGRQIHLRALHVGEEWPIRTLMGRLSAESRYRRFLSPMPALPDAVVRGLAAVDYRSSLAIVVEDEEDADDVIALASYSAVDTQTAEVAVAVRDDWQGCGVGTALVDVLLAAADRRGVRRFAASITTENVAMRRILARFGRVLSSRTSSGVSEVEFVRHAAIGT